MPDLVVSQGVGKRFRCYSQDRPRTFQKAFLKSWRGLRPVEEFWALEGVSFSVGPGEMLGIVGANGAGKSTLLRLIGGVIEPDAGSITTTERIGALIDLGAGFHPDLSGRENIFINGVISGLTRREVEREFDSIVAFAELEDFIDNPLRTYSTGMWMRLAFAVAAQIQPEILLIDEVLAVGDLAFQRKCLDRINQFKADGCAILLVSHDAGLVGQMCDQALWLCAGSIAALGPAQMVTGQYVTAMQAETNRQTPPGGSEAVASSGATLRLNENRFGSQEMQITDVRLYGAPAIQIAELQSGQPFREEIDYLATQPVTAPIFGVTITKEDGVICYDGSTASAGLSLPNLLGKGKVALQFERLDLMGGNYFIDVGVYREDWSYAYDYHWHVYTLQVNPAPSEKGVLRPPHHWEF